MRTKKRVDINTRGHGEANVDHHNNQRHQKSKKKTIDEKKKKPKKKTTEATKNIKKKNLSLSPLSALPLVLAAASSSSSSSSAPSPRPKHSIGSSPKRQRQDSNASFSDDSVTSSTLSTDSRVTTTSTSSSESNSDGHSNTRQPPPHQPKRHVKKQRRQRRHRVVTTTTSDSDSSLCTDLEEVEEEKPYTIVELKRNTKALEHDRYLFNFEKTLSDGSKTLKCRSFKSPSYCQARAKLTPAGVLKTKPYGIWPHSHEDDRTVILQHLVKARARAAVEAKPTKPMSQLYNEVVRKTLDELNAEGMTEAEVFAAIPVFNSVQSTLARCRHLKVPKNPKSLQDIDLPEPWQQDIDGKPFLLVNDGDEERILVFGTVQFLGYLCDAKQIFMDGTFYTAPRLFQQMYTMHASIRDTTVPLLYALLPNKTQETYVRLLRAIQNVSQKHGFSFCPPSFQVDFELAAINAVHLVFATAQVKGCFFHFTQAIWRQVKSNQLQSMYHTNAKVYQLVKRMTALPLVKHSDVRRVWKLIKHEAPKHFPGVNELLTYFYANWVSASARFRPLKMWNHFGNYRTRTNNDVEGWHCWIKKFFGKAHPTLFDFIDMIRLEQSRSQTTLSFLRSGQVPRPRRMQFVKLNKRIKLLTEQYVAQPSLALQFLDSVGYQLKLAHTSNNNEDRNEVNLEPAETTVERVDNVVLSSSRKTNRASIADTIPSPSTIRSAQRFSSLPGTSQSARSVRLGSSGSARKRKSGHRGHDTSDEEDTVLSSSVVPPKPVPKSRRSHSSPIDAGVGQMSGPNRGSTANTLSEQTRSTKNRDSLSGSDSSPDSSSELSLRNKTRKKTKKSRYNSQR